MAVLYGFNVYLSIGTRMVEPIIRRRGRTPKASPSPLAARLVEARLKTGTTQKELAERLGCGWRSIQDYEQGRAIPGGNVLAGYGELGINLNWLLTGVDTNASSVDNEFLRVPHFQLADVDVDFSVTSSPSSVIQLSRSLLEKLLGKAQQKIDASLLASITVEDDNMAPEVPKGSVVIFKSYSVRPVNTGLYVIPLNDQLAVRLSRINLDGHSEIIELRYPARSIVIENSGKALPNAYRVIATLSAQVDPAEIIE